MDLVDHATLVAQEALARALPERWMHVLGVRDRVISVKNICQENEKEILVASALLHDIGYSPVAKKSGFHPIDGAEYLKDQGFPARLCSLVANHSCARIEAEMRGLSDWHSKWKDEDTFIRDALWWADMTTTPTGEVTDINKRIEEIKKRYGFGSLVSKFIDQARPELLAAVDRVEKMKRNSKV